MALNPTYDYNTPQIQPEQDQNTIDIDMTNKENFDIRKLEGLGIEYNREK